MKLSTLIGFVLFITLFSYSSLTLLGSSLPLAVIAGIFFIVISFMIVFVIISFKLVSEINTSSFLQIFFLCICLSLCIILLKSFFLQSDNFHTEVAIFSNEIDSIEALNNYYNEYVDYISNQTQIYQENNALLEKSINSKKKDLNSIALESNSLNLNSVGSSLVNTLAYSIDYHDNEKYGDNYD